MGDSRLPFCKNHRARETWKKVIAICISFVLTFEEMCQNAIWEPSLTKTNKTKTNDGRPRTSRKGTPKSSKITFTLQKNIHFHCVVDQKHCFFGFFLLLLRHFLFKTVLYLFLHCKKWDHVMLLFKFAIFTRAHTHSKFQKLVIYKFAILYFSWAKLSM